MSSDVKLAIAFMFFALAWILNLTQNNYIEGAKLIGLMWVTLYFMKEEP